MGAHVKIRFPQTKVVEKRCIVTYKEFVMMDLIWGMPFLHVIRFIDLSMKWGGVAILSGCLLISLCLNIPLLMLLLFLGSYARAGYIRFWNFMPILRGVGYACAIYVIIAEFFNISSSAIAVLYIMNIIMTGKVPWVNCDFKKASKNCIPLLKRKTSYLSAQYYTGIYGVLTRSDNDAIPKANPIFFNGSPNITINGTTNRFMKCCLYSLNTAHECENKGWQNNFASFSSYDYFRYNILEEESINNSVIPKPTLLNTRWIIVVVLIWLLIFYYMFQEFGHPRNIEKMFLKALVYFTFGLAAISFVLSSFYPATFLVQSSLSEVLHLLNSHYWLDILPYLFSSKIPANMILLGAISPGGIMPTDDVFILYGIKFIFYLISIMWTSIGIHTILVMYGIKDPKCLHILGEDVMFAMIPDTVSIYARNNFLQVTVLCLWYFMYFIYGITSTSYTMKAFFYSFKQQHPTVNKTRALSSGLLCIVCAALNCIILSPSYIKIRLAWTKIGLSVLSIVFIAMFFVAVFTYSIRMINNDFYFTYGKPLSSYWINMLKLTNITIIIATVSVILYHSVTMSRNFTTIHFMCYGIVLSLILLIFCITIWIIFKTLRRQTLKDLVRPSKDWGPYNPAKRSQRELFNPEREVRYRLAELFCNHNCLRGSKKLLKKQMQLQKTAHILGDPDLLHYKMYNE